MRWCYLLHHAYFRFNLLYDFCNICGCTASNGEHIIEKTYPGTTSPPGCGPPSQYIVKLSITAHK